MPLVHGSSNEAKSENISRLEHENYPHDQAIAIALNVAREHRADGGPFDLSALLQAVEGKHKKRPKLHVGSIHSAVAGRTDHLPMHVPPDAYVLPADVVSALGEGNTAAGFKVAHDLFEPPEWFHGVPYGGRGLPYGVSTPAGKADGGAASSGVPIVAAGGEHVISPLGVLWTAHRFGRRDAADGHRIIDAFVKQVRSNNIKTLSKLPGPRRD